MSQTINIIGGGAAALSVAAFLDSSKFEINIYEQQKSLGRKFLVAGKGGFNLSYDEPLESLSNRYLPQGFLNPALAHFDNTHFREWLDKIGIPTYVGTSHRIFPIEGTKPITVLNKMIDCLTANKVKIHYESTWTGWNEDGLMIINDTPLAADAINIFALGGASWKITGSDGSWLKYFKRQKIKTSRFQASNCECFIKWPQLIIERHAGLALKNIALSCDQETHKGEVVITEKGLEGNAIYALSPSIRQNLKKYKIAKVFLDLKPTVTLEDVQKKIENSKEKNTTDALRVDLRLSKTQLALIKTMLTKEQFIDLAKLSDLIKNLPLEITALGPIDKAISTIGGIPPKSLDEHYQITTLPDNYCIGEMVDWDAPTGGYLLQACFSMGAYLADHLNGTIEI